MRLQQYKRVFQQGQKKHEQMIFWIKVLLLLGMTIMACLYQYTDFIREHRDLFAQEVFLYMGCAAVAYLFTCFLRNQSFQTWNFWKGLGMMTVVTGVVAILAEIAGMNTLFMHPSENMRQDGVYRKKALQFKSELWGKMVIAVNATFLVALILWHLQHNDRVSFVLLVVGLVVAMFSLHSTFIQNIHAGLSEQGWLVEGSDVADSQIGMSLFYSTLFGTFVLVVLLTSLLRYKSFKIYSYFPDNPNMCGTKRAAATFLLFFFESAIVAAMFSAPLLYVVNNRNEPELGHDYSFVRDKHAFVEFGLLTTKVFVFLVALQMTGFFDSYNDGFCRVDQCNVRSAQCSPPS